MRVIGRRSAVAAGLVVLSGGGGFAYAAWMSKATGIGTVTTAPPSETQGARPPRDRPSA